MYKYEDVLANCTKYFDGDELAASVIVSKYLLKDSNGDFLEKDPDDMFRNRIVPEFKRTEDKYVNPLPFDEIYGLMNGFRRVLPQGSPLYGIGNNEKLMSLGNCFVKGTEVLTRDGQKKIEDVKIGDFVLTNGGTWEKVSQLHNSPLDGRQLYELKCFKTPGFACTGNHEFFSISKEQIAFGLKPKYNATEYLRVGDYIALPKRTDAGKIGFEIDLRDIFSLACIEIEGCAYDVAHDEKKKETSFTSKWDNAGTTCRKQHNPVKTNWIVDEDFSYFLGLWFGDGCVFSQNTKRNLGKRERKSRKDKVCDNPIKKSKNRIRGITFTFGTHEDKLIKFVSEFGEKCFGIVGNINNSNASNTTQITFHSAVIGYAFESLFGRYCDGKRLPSDIYEWDGVLVKKLIQGLIDSDGTITKDGGIYVTLANTELVKSFYYLCRSFGIPAGLRPMGSKISQINFPCSNIFAENSLKSYEDKRVENGFNKALSPAKDLIEIDGRLFARIDKKALYNGSDERVYNIGVDNDHSYVVNGVVCKNCFVVESPEDSYGGILKTDQELVQIMKRRGGVGTDISTIRPKNLPVNNAAITTDGIEVFMKRFSNTTHEVAQNGRRGALLLGCHCLHPQIGTFITVKRDRKKVTGANISVKWTDEFLKAVENDGEVVLRFPVDSKPEDAIFRETVKAKEIWTEFVRSAHASAEPGCFFWDTVIRQSISDCYASDGFATICSNPCGEILMSMNNSCLLMALNLVGFVKDMFKKSAKFDFDEFGDVVRKATRLIDDLVDLEIEKNEKILEKIKNDKESDSIKQVEMNLWKNVIHYLKKGRRVGLGVTGLADMLAMIGIKYDSDESMKFIDNLFSIFHAENFREQAILAKERGAFECWNWEKEKDCHYIKILPTDVQELVRLNGRRNISSTTCAPVGSLSCCTQTSSGIEPVFRRSYQRRKKLSFEEEKKGIKPDDIDTDGNKWISFEVFHEGLKKWMEVTGKTDVKESPYYGCDSSEISWSNRIKIQGIIQKYITHSISSTINLPKDTTEEVISAIYLEGWKAGCKGLTVYRDGCRDGVLISEEVQAEKKGVDKEGRPLEISVTPAPKRPESLPVHVYSYNLKGAKWIFFVGLFNGKPYEIFGGKEEFITLPKKYIKSNETKNVWILKERKEKGCCQYSVVLGSLDKTNEDYQKIDDIASLFPAEMGTPTRLISALLRHGMRIQDIIEQLKKVPQEDSMFTFESGVRRVLKNYVLDGVQLKEKCKECSGDMVYENGCASCKNCGYSKCS
jgi:ribonucleoside-diphosphate reductase alpha chain